MREFCQLDRLCIRPQVLNGIDAQQSLGESLAQRLHRPLRAGARQKNIRTLPSTLAQQP